jgi:hypothetical protein
MIQARIQPGQRFDRYPAQRFGMTLRKMPTGAQHRLDVLAAAVQKDDKGSVRRRGIAETLEAASNTVVSVIATHVLQIDRNLGAADVDPRTRSLGPASPYLRGQNVGRR